MGRRAAEAVRKQIPPEPLGSFLKELENLILFSS